MRNFPKVDIIMPLYNPNDWVFEAIDSVLNQTYSNWHFYIVDDFTPQLSDTLAKVKSFCKTNPKLTFIQLVENQGPHNALNVGTLAGTGDFLTFIDQDDAWDYGRLEKSMNLLIKNPGMALVHSNIQGIDYSGKRILAYEEENSRRKKTPYSEMGKVSLSKMLVQSTSIRMGTIVVTREAFLGVGMFFVATRTASSTLFLVSIAANHPIGFIPEKFTFRRSHNIQLNKANPFVNNISMMKALKMLSISYPHLFSVCNIRYKRKLRGIILLELKLGRLDIAKRHAVHYLNALTIRSIFYSLLFLPLFVNLDSLYIHSLLRKRLNDV